MSAQQRWELQQAVYSRLTSQLAGQGPSGTNVIVYDHVPSENEASRVHCRIDGFNIVQRPIKSNKTLHAFNVHIFDRPTEGTNVARGQKTVAVLLERVISALHDWKPSVTGASAIHHDTSDVMPDEDGLTQHALGRFTIHIAAS